MDFVANFMENTIVKKFENRSKFVKVMNGCVVAQFLLRHGVEISLYRAVPQLLRYFEPSRRRSPVCRKDGQDRCPLAIAMLLDAR